MISKHLVFNLCSAGRTTGNNWDDVFIYYIFFLGRRILYYFRSYLHLTLFAHACCKWSKRDNFCGGWLVSLRPSRLNKYLLLTWLSLLLNYGHVNRLCRSSSEMLQPSRFAFLMSFAISCCALTYLLPHNVAIINKHDLNGNFVRVDKAGIQAFILLDINAGKLCFLNAFLWIIWLF